METMTNEALWLNEDGDLCIRYFGGHLCFHGEAVEAHTSGGSVLGPFETESDAKRALDAWEGR